MIGLLPLLCLPCFCAHFQHLSGRGKQLPGSRMLMVHRPCTGHPSTAPRTRMRWGLSGTEVWVMVWMMSLHGIAWHGTARHVLMR